MGAAERSARRAHNRALAMPVATKRSARFAARMAGIPLPTFADLEHPPRWRQLLAAGPDDLATITTLLHMRPVLDAELNGQQLTRIAHAVGEARLDCICEQDVRDLPLAAADSGFPALSEIGALGRHLLDRAATDPAHALLAERAATVLDTAEGVRS